MRPNIADFLDNNHMVRPRRSWMDSGNGPFYSVFYIVMLLLAKKDISYFASDWFREIARECEPEVDGLMFRNPDRSYGQEQWDNMLAWIVGCIIFGHHDLAKRIFWYGVRHFGFYNTDSKFEMKDWLWRHVHVFSLLVPACWPKTAFLVRPFLGFISSFFDVDAREPGGNHLNLVFFYGCRRIGMKAPKLEACLALTPVTTRMYFDLDHTLVSLADDATGSKIKDLFQQSASLAQP